MKLYTNVRSPFARKVRVLAREKGIPLEEVETMTADDPAELLAANPLGKIPALVLDDGTALVDSPVICEYLDSLIPVPPFFPKAGPARFRALHFQALADGIMDAAVQTVMEGRRPAEKQSPQGNERQMQKIDRTLAWLEGQAISQQLATIGEISIACALGYLNFRLPHLHWVISHPVIAAWYESIHTHPSLMATRPSE